MTVLKSSSKECSGGAIVTIAGCDPLAEGKQAASLQLGAIIRTEEQEEEQERQWEVQGGCHCTLPLTGQTQQMRDQGPRACSRLSGLTTAFQAKRLDCHLMTFCPEQSVHRANCTTCMSLVAQCAFRRNACPMEC